MSEGIRINKYISTYTDVSRKEADRLIENGKVFVNGKEATLAMKINDSDIVTVNGVVVVKHQERIYIMLHKPAGVVSSVDPKTKDNVVNYIKHRSKIFPIGRLDKESVGLLLLTNDGDIVNKILREEYNHEKEYLVKVDPEIVDEDLIKLSKGVEIFNPVTNKYQVTKECIVERVSTNSFKIILKQGLNRQIRRMCTVLGYQVAYLKRVRVMHLKLDTLPLGKWRYLTNEEIKILYRDTDHK